jgi:photosystem II stability/assembly factor-like uncharacterized protein
MLDAMSSVLLCTEDAVMRFDGDDNRGPRTELDGRRVRSLARHGDEWWAIADRRTVVRRDADGTWHDEAETDESALTCLLPAPDGAHVGTGDARLLRLFRGAFAPVGGFDDVPGRDTWHAVGSSVPYVRSMTATRLGVLMASVHVGGIPRSANNGTTWKPTIDVDDDVHEVRAHPSDPKIVMAAAAVGLAESADAGETWSVRTDGLHATYLRAVAFTRDAVLVSASNGPRGDQSAIYRRSMSGGSLERCQRGLPEWLAGNVDTGCLDAAASLGNELAVFADADGTVYESSDGGVTWTVLASDLGNISAVGVRV